VLLKIFTPRSMFASNKDLIPSGAKPKEASGSGASNETVGLKGSYDSIKHPNRHVVRRMIGLWHVSLIEVRSKRCHSVRCDSTSAFVARECIGKVKHGWTSRA